MEKKRPTAGRPPLASDRLVVRIDPLHKADLSRAASLAGVSMSVLVNELLSSTISAAGDSRELAYANEYLRLRKKGVGA